MTEILGLPLVAMVLIVSISGTVLYHLRNLPKGNYSIRGIVDNRLTLFGTSIAGGFVALPEVTKLATTSEAQLLAILATIGSIAGFAMIGQKTNAIKTRRAESKTMQILSQTDLYTRKPAITQKTLKGKQKSLMMPPSLGPVGEWYQTNFTNHKTKGNILPYGESYLWVKMSGVKSYLNVILQNSKGNAIQIDQSHELDEDNNIETTRLEMFAKNGQPLPRGKYTIQTRGDRGTSDSAGIKADEFYIV